jgi:hypothetical protein
LHIKRQAMEQTRSKLINRAHTARKGYSKLVFCGHGGGDIRMCMLPDSAKKSACQFYCETALN